MNRSRKMSKDLTGGRPEIHQNKNDKCLFFFEDFYMHNYKEDLLDI